MKFFTSARHNTGFRVVCRFEGKKRRIAQRIGQKWSASFSIAALPRQRFARLDFALRDVKDRVRRGVWETYG